MSRQLDYVLTSTVVELSQLMRHDEQTPWTSELVGESNDFFLMLNMGAANVFR